MSVTREQIVDKDKALDYCEDFYDRHKLALEAMAFGAQTAASTFTSVFTEKKHKDFARAVAEGVFLVALAAAPGGVTLTATWRTLMAGRTAAYAARTEWLLSQIPTAAQTVAKSAKEIETEKKRFKSRTELLREVLVNIGNNLFKQMDALLEERNRARQTIYNCFLNDYDDGNKCWVGLEVYAKALLGDQPTWDDELMSDVTARFEKELFKAYVKHKVTISNPMPLVYELYDGIEEPQFEYIKKSYPEINEIEDLIYKWNANKKAREYSPRGYGW